MRARTRRARVVAVVVVVGLVGSSLLGAIAAFSSRSRVEIPRQGPWTVLVAGDLTSVASCTQDPAVADAFVGADDPTNGGGIVLASDARVADVERVVTCVARGVDPARISVITTPQDLLAL